jgi:hypothetical protein
VGSNPIGSTNLTIMDFHVYILQSETSGRFYIGQTFGSTNLKILAQLNEKRHQLIGTF